jgi:hypothetical protein
MHHSVEICWGTVGFVWESVGGQSPLSAFDPLEAEERLRLASGKIRFEIAGYLHRKRVPELKFRVIPPPADRQ